MKNILLLFAFSLTLHAHAQGKRYETLTYKTRKEDPATRTLLQRLFPPPHPQPIPDENTVSAEVLVEGEASLYLVDAYPGKCFLPAGKKPFFFLKTAKGLFPLIGREQTGAVIEFQPYWGSLMAGLQDWNEKERRITQLARSANGFSIEGLVNLITDYNNYRKTGL